MRFDFVMAAALLLPAIGAIGCGSPPEAQSPVTPVTPLSTETAVAPAPAMAGPSAAGASGQIAMGKKVYADKCASCHGAKGEGDATDPPVIGKAALTLDPPAKSRIRKGQFKTAADLAKFVKNSMPMDSPGSLSDDDSNASTAYILDANGIKVDKKVDTSSGAGINLR